MKLIMIKAAVLSIAFLITPLSLSAQPFFTEDEKALILSHGPWPPDDKPDTTNRFSGNLTAIKLGKQLFTDKGLSASGKFSCASCHQPEHSFTDGRKTAETIATGFRNTPTLINARFQHWYGWAGSVDTLWGASLRAILNPIEMAGSSQQIAFYVDSNPSLKGRFLNLAGPNWSEYSADRKLVTIGKSLAAYMESLTSERTSFDQFRDALASNDKAGLGDYPENAKRGLKLFVGRGHCSLCHFGPLFTNLEFADAGIPYFISPGVIDKGRYQGIKDLRSSAYSSLGTYSYDVSGQKSILASHVTLRHQNWGEFKVPSLRNVSKTAPYMHNGSLSTLEDVINHYSELNEERLHTDGAALLRALNLTDTEKEDLLAFLKTL